MLPIGSGGAILLRVEGGGQYVVLGYKDLVPSVVGNAEFASLVVMEQVFSPSVVLKTLVVVLVVEVLTEILMVVELLVLYGW